LPGPALQVSHSDSHACAVLADGKVFCHGQDDLVLADGVPVDGIAGAYSSIPVELPGIDDAEQVAVAMDSTCVLRRSGNVTCFDATDMIGLGPAEGSAGRREITELRDVVRIISTSVGTCALAAGGALYCWGLDLCGAFADRSGECVDEFVTTPTLVPGFDSIKHFVSDSWNSCATNLKDEVWCRGGRWDTTLPGWTAAPGVFRLPL